MLPPGVRPSLLLPPVDGVEVAAGVAASPDVEVAAAEELSAAGVVVDAAALDELVSVDAAVEDESDVVDPLVSAGGAVELEAVVAVELSAGAGVASAAGVEDPAAGATGAGLDAGVAGRGVV